VTDYRGQLQGKMIGEVEIAVVVTAAIGALDFARSRDFARFALNKG
jgi:hypothetical protein